jgi:hypothetical protein
VSARLKSKALSGLTVTLKLKTADFKIRTRARSLGSATQLAGRIFIAARDLLEREADGTKFRLLGVGASALTAAEEAILPTSSTAARPRRSTLSTAFAPASGTAPWSGGGVRGAGEGLTVIRGRASEP